MNAENYHHESVGVRQYLQHSIPPFHVLRCGVVEQLREPGWHCILRCQDHTALRPPFSFFLEFLEAEHLAAVGLFVMEEDEK